MIILAMSGLSLVGFGIFCRKVATSASSVLLLSEELDAPKVFAAATAERRAISTSSPGMEEAASSLARLSHAVSNGNPTRSISRSGGGVPLAPVASR